MAAPKQERLEARVDAEKKALFQRAADLRGMTLTAFLIDSALTVAQQTIQQYEVTILGQRDRQVFFEALLNPPAPNGKLRRAAERHKERLAP